MFLETNKELPEILITCPQHYNLKDPDSEAIKSVYTISAQDIEATVKHGENFDPFKERQVANPMTDCDTLAHLSKASMGPGILAIPFAFYNAGLMMGVVLMILVAIICTHCAYIFVKSAHVLYRRNHRTAMTFAEVVEISFSTGPTWARPFARPSRYIIQVSLFVTYFGSCCVYAVIIATNFQYVLNHHLDYEVNLRLVILSLLVPLVLISWVPDLKYLAPVSIISNLLLSIGLGVTFYYLIKDLEPTDAERVSLIAPVSQYPSFFSIVIFSIEAIGIIMPLENSMKTPQHFVGVFGVLNKGMSGVTVIYIFLGILGYLRYGHNTRDSITLNLPIEEIPAQIVNILIGLAVYFTFTLTFFVCFGIVWNGVSDRFQKKPLIANYVLRTVLVTSAVLVAVAVPTFGPFIGLVGAFCFSTLGILIPVVVETMTYWEIGFGRFNWMAIKNVSIFIFGIIALVFGSSTSISEIILVLLNSDTETKENIEYNVKI